MLRIKHILFLSVLILFYSSCSKVSEPEIFKLNGTTMGTFFEIKIVPDKTDSLEQSIDDISAGIENVLKAVNLKMSTYIKDSEISRFNALDKDDWFPVSYDVVKVVENANDISRLSDGAFDITVGPLVNLWGFGPEKRPTRIPSDAEIQERMKMTGFGNLSVQENPPALRKSNPKIYCDLSAIAKGYGVDVVADYLDSLGIANFLVEIGGEIQAKGFNQKGELWKIGISTPSAEAGIQKVVHVKNISVATSGDYRNYFEENNVRYSHTIDPRTGKPITHSLASVTVIDSLCMVADGLATAIDVLGPEKGFKLALDENLAVFMIIRENGAFVEKMTPQFEKFLINK